MTSIPDRDDEEKWMDLFDYMNKNNIPPKKWREDNMNKDRDRFYKKKLERIDKETFNQ